MLVTRSGLLRVLALSPIAMNGLDPKCDGTSRGANTMRQLSLRRVLSGLAVQRPAWARGHAVSLCCGALVVAGWCAPAHAQLDITRDHGSSGAELIYVLDSGMQASTASFLNLTINNVSGFDWSDYTFQLPDALAGPNGTFMGAALNSGAFNNVFITADQRYLGATGGTVSNGAGFSLSLGISHQLQPLFGAPTPLASNPSQNYMPPDAFVHDPVVPAPLPADPGTWEPPPMPPDPVPIETYIVSRTTCTNGNCLDVIVGFDPSTGHYDVVTNGILTGGGSFNGDPSSWPAQAAALVPEPATWATLLGGLAALLAVLRRRSSSMPVPVRPCTGA